MDFALKLIQREIDTLLEHCEDVAMCFHPPMNSVTTGERWPHSSVFPNSAISKTIC
jgi:hypothetical protein